MEQSNEQRKLATIEDFLTNEFCYDQAEYTHDELFKLLCHVNALMATVDGTLTPRQQVYINGI